MKNTIKVAVLDIAQRNYDFFQTNPSVLILLSNIGYP